jgi:hypothetical protein
MKIGWATAEQFEELRKEFPGLYAETFDFSVPLGWFDLVRSLSRAVAARAEAIAERTGDEVRVVQVKEKLGGLRFYTHADDDAVRWLIRDAEERASNTCMCCGGTEDVRMRQTKSGWYFTACDGCLLMDALAGGED